MLVFEHKIALYPENFGKFVQEDSGNLQWFDNTMGLGIFEYYKHSNTDKQHINEMLSNYVIVSAQVHVLNKFVFVFDHLVS